jgi:diguanylate cyclase (GGDEF)-like protein
MEQVREAVLECLDAHKNEEKLIQELTQLAQRLGRDVYPAIFNVLTNLYLDGTEAERCWHEIITHYESLNDSLKRSVSLRTAICDYFCSIHKSLENPKVVEIKIFEKAVKASRYDSLTGLFNRQTFDETLEREINRARRHNLNLSILFFDLDDFKRINDSLGHQAGDMVLQHAAGTILSEKRSEDIAARYGGEEIVVILPETDKVNALVLGERIRRKVEKASLKFRGKKIRYTISGGLAEYPNNAEDASGLLKSADSALYRAKGSGKNNISFFSKDKRRYLRIDLNRKIKVREIGFDETGSQTARGKNICMGGILFENDFPIPIGNKVQLSIPTHTPKPLFIIGTVVRVESFGPSQFDIGVSISFLEMDKAIKDEISKWLKLKRGTFNVPGDVSG